MLLNPCMRIFTIHNLLPVRTQRIPLEESVVHNIKLAMNKDNLEDRKKVVTGNDLLSLYLKDTNGNCMCSSKWKKPWVGLLLPFRTIIKKTIEKANISMEEAVGLYRKVPSASKPQNNALIERLTMITCCTTCLDASLDMLLKTVNVLHAASGYTELGYTASTPDSCCSLTERKVQGCLKYPHHNVFRIIKVCNTIYSGTKHCQYIKTV